MNNDLRIEFEEYVKKLTTAICDNIFLARMEQLFSKYDKEYDLYVDLFKKSDNARLELGSRVNDAAKTIKAVETNSNETLTRLNNEITDFSSSAEKMVADLYNYNDEKAEEFVKQLASYIEQYKQETALVFEEGEKKISTKLAGVITPEILQHFLDELEKNTNETKTLATFINDSYKKEIEENIKSMVASNEATLKTMDATVSEYVKSMLETLNEAQDNAKNQIDASAKTLCDTTTNNVNKLVQQLNWYIYKEKEDREKAIEEQKKLIASIGPSDEKMNQLEQKVFRVEKAVSEMKTQENENDEKILDMLDNILSDYRELKEQETKKAKQSKLVNISSAITMLLACLIFILEGNNAFGFIGLLITLVIVVITVMVVPNLREKVLSIIKSVFTE